MRSRTLTLLALAALPAAAVAAPAGPKPAPKQVVIDNFRFQPAALTVPVGTKVTWVNRDGEPHTVVSAAGRFKSPALDTDGTFSYTFTARGTYDYFCSVHPMMTGRVTVK